MGAQRHRVTGPAVRVAAPEGTGELQIKGVDRVSIDDGRWLGEIVAAEPLAGSGSKGGRPLGE
jgi:hypothetical protein